MNRAYSILAVKSVDEEKRIVRGIATTPTTDRQDDIVESSGAEFSLPIPFLWQHDADCPVGNVTKAKVTKTGIEVEVQLAKTDETGSVKDRLDSAWQDIKLGLVRGLSIGFKPLESTDIDGTWGRRYVKWLWLELSGVTIAANGECSITNIKKIDTAQRAATGHTSSREDRTTPPASGKKKSTPVKAQEGKTMKKSYAEQISAFTTTLETKNAAIEAIADSASDKGETLDADQKETVATLKAEIKEIEDHLDLLKGLEERNKKAVVVVNGKDTKSAADSRDGRTITVTTQKALPKGYGFVRLLGAKFMGREENMPAYQIAESKGWGEDIVNVLKMPNHILKTAIAAGSTTDSTWAGPLVTYNNLQEEFIGLQRANSLIARMSNLRKVPFNIKVPRQTASTTAYWVGQGSPKPVSKGAMDTVTLDFAKIAGITFQTQELLRFSRPNSEQLMVDDLTQAITYLMDRDFLDPAKALVTGVSPASITNGSTSITASGITSDAFRVDFALALRQYTSANYGLKNLVIVMTETQAMMLSLMRTDFNSKLFPDLTSEGGSIEGVQVLTTENIVANGGSPADGALIAFINAKDILMADDGAVDIDISTEASIQTDSAPDSPVTASTTLLSLWQTNMVAIRCERFINWTKARTDSVVYITGGNYSVAS